MLNQPIRCQSLVGRSAYLADIDRLLDMAAQGQRQLVLLSGDAGIGKSRLTTEIRNRAEASSFVTLEGQCFPSDRTVPYAPILDLLRTRYTQKQTPEQKDNTTLQKLGQLLPGIAPLSPNPGVPLSLEPEAHKQQLITMLLAFFAEFTAQSPLLLIFEDLHWSDEASLDFLLYLTRWSATQPLLLLLTYRTDEENPALQRWLAQIDHERFTVELRLTPLAREDVAAMIQQMLGQPVSVDIQDATYALAEGNPFFVEELLKALMASGGIILVDGAWRYVSRQVALHVPRSIQAMIRQRIALLSRSSQPVLQIASVIGRRFTFTLLQTLAGLDESTLLNIVKELMAGQFVVQESAEEFVFRHALTREVVYQELLVRERQRLHQTVAETLEQLAETARTPYLTEMAYHFYQAEVWDKASQYAQLAGEEAHALYAPYAAIEQWSRVLDANQHLGRPPSSYIYWSRGRAYEITGAFELARGDFEQALSLAQADHDGVAEWRSLIALGFLWTGRDYTRAGQLYQQAIELARRTQEPLLLARSLNHLGNWYSNLEQPHEALLAHQQALTIFQRADQEADLAATYDLMGMTAMLGGDLLQATEYYQQAIPYLQKVHDQQRLTSSLATLTVLGEGGSSETETLVSAPTRYATSLAYGERAFQTAQEIGHRPAEAYALSALAQYLGPHGEYDRAFDTIQASLALAEQIDHHEWCTAAHWQLGVLYLDLLALSQAKQHLEQALGIARRMGSRNWMRITAAFLARLLLLEGEHTKAEMLLNEVLATDAPAQTIGQRLVWDARAALALAQGRPEVSLDILDRLVSSAANLSEGLVIPHLWKTRGEALAALGRKAEAEAAIQAAYVAAQAQGLRPLCWRAALLLGKLYRSEGRRVEANRMLSVARTIIGELAGALSAEPLRQHFLAATEQMLPRLRPPTSRRLVNNDFEGLTAREREVATLIGRGYTNRAIAKQLVLSERTVEGHVTAILTKLGGSTRTQIATWAVEKGLTRST